jgi:hypothetical protein
MMRLVIEYTEGDGCSWYATNTIPVEYESAEAFAVEFEEACHLQYNKNSWQHKNFILAGKEWDVDDFFDDGNYCPPEVLTVDEWFTRPHQG